MRNGKIQAHDNRQTSVRVSAFLVDIAPLQWYSLSTGSLQEQAGKELLKYGCS